MGETLHKAFSFQVKDIGNRILEFTGSTETMDRDGEIIKADGWDLKNYKNNPVVLFGHDYGSLPVAKCVKAWVEGGKLKFQDQFPTADEYEYADTVYKLCKGGYLNTVSVGFIPLKSEPGKGECRKTFTHQELLEHSIVPVPSNPDALRNAVDAKLITVKELNAITKPKATQAEIKDQIDYLEALIEEAGLSDETKESGQKLIKRFSASDKAVENKSATIRSLVDNCNTVMKAMTDHHLAHMVAYDSMQRGLSGLAKSLEDGDSGNQDETPMGQGPQNVTDPCPQVTASAPQAERKDLELKEISDYMTNEIKRLIGGK